MKTKQVILMGQAFRSSNFLSTVTIRSNGSHVRRPDVEAKPKP